MERNEQEQMNQFESDLTGFEMDLSLAPQDLTI